MGMDMNKINELISCLKRITNNSNLINIPFQGDYDKLELKSSHFHFWVDINRKGRKKPKCTLQLREQQHKDFALLRLDLLGPPHPNPEGDYPFAGELIPCPHLHIAHPEYGSSIAYPLDSTYAKMYLNDQQLQDIVQLLRAFLERCNVGNINDYNYQEQSRLF